MFEETLVEADIHPEYHSAALTHTGCVRSTNQDAFVERAGIGLWAVADGMGGHRDGDVASRMVCKVLKDLQPGATYEATVTEVQRQVCHVNAKLYAAAVRPIDPVRSGTTIVALVVQRTACAILWAGDSRVYRLRDQKLVQLTIDHTWASQRIPDRHSLKEVDHAITRAVGGEATLLLDIKHRRVRLGDRYLLCSDGLTRELPPERIAELLSEGDAQECSQALLDATLQAGARDNVTVVVVDAR